MIIIIIYLFIYLFMFTFMGVRFYFDIKSSEMFLVNRFQDDEGLDL